MGALAGAGGGGSQSRPAERTPKGSGGRDGRGAGCWVGGLGLGGRDEGVGFRIVGIGLEGGCDSELH